MSIAVLGIDPGFAHFGHALVRLEAFAETVIRLGVIGTKKSSRKRNVFASDDNLRRARELARALTGIVKTEGVRLFCVESMSFVRNASASQKVGIAWGVVATVAEAQCIPIVQASPQEIKLAVCGEASASKDEVQAALVRRYGAHLARMVVDLSKGQHEHPFDALAAVVAALESDAVRMARGMAIAAGQ